MSEILPLQLEVAGVPRIFTLEDTEVHLYRFVSDALYSHVKTREYDSQVVHLFNVPNLLVMLSGQEVYGHTLDKRGLKKATTILDKECGWNARTVTDDSCPEEIKDRYINIATAALRQEVVVIPESWNS